MEITEKRKSHLSKKKQQKREVSNLSASLWVPLIAGSYGNINEMVKYCFMEKN
jgi:hypothetical protein